MKLNREELAWAAGLFDGEGNVGVFKAYDRKTFEAKRIMLSMAQTDPQVLERFQRAVFGLGSINGPYNWKSPFKAKSRWVFRAGSFEHVQAIIAALWVFLSPVKLAQAKKALVDYAEYRANWTGRKLPSS